MSTQTNTRIPTPIYAVAGAGDLALQQLRKLPAKAAKLRTKVASSDIDLNLDVAQLRTLAVRNAVALNTYAQAAQERVLAVYADLVAHGERVIGARDGADGASAIDAVITAKAPAAEVKAHATDVKAHAAAKASAAKVNGVAHDAVKVPAAKKTRPAAGK